jgi:hypothetical protein
VEAARTPIDRHELPAISGGAGTNSHEPTLLAAIKGLSAPCRPKRIEASALEAVHAKRNQVRCPMVRPRRSGFLCIQGALRGLDGEVAEQELDPRHHHPR